MRNLVGMEYSQKLRVDGEPRIVATKPHIWKNKFQTEVSVFVMDILVGDLVYTCHKMTQTATSLWLHSVIKIRPATTEEVVGF